ncbi:MAG: ribosomal protein S18-alanine N-acetyltransferase [Blautia sp.]|nr:ribosomal protein S18-alanine N-acetyltransferase [Blautia sp.]
MTLREMTVEDLDQVAAIEAVTVRPPWTKEGFLSFLIKKETLFVVVEEKGTILGYAGMLWALDEGDITNVVVRPERQREGIGAFLLDGLIRVAEDFGITLIHLDVREGNGVARRLYERAGFVQDGRRENYYTDPKEAAILMSRRKK